MSLTVSGGGTATPPLSETEEDVATAELSVVQAVLALQGGVLQDRGLGASPRFTVQLATA